jgi:hypothetical protein
MEPDGAVLQLHPRAQHRRARSPHRLSRRTRRQIAVFATRPLTTGAGLLWEVRLWESEVVPAQLSAGTMIIFS